MQVAVDLRDGTSRSTSGSNAFTGVSEHTLEDEIHLPANTKTRFGVVMIYTSMSSNCYGMTEIGEVEGLFYKKQFITLISRLRGPTMMRNLLAE
jgi:hypothetical protein